MLSQVVIAFSSSYMARFRVLVMVFSWLLLSVWLWLFWLLALVVGLGVALMVIFWLLWSSVIVTVFCRSLVPGLLGLLLSWLLGPWIASVGGM